MLKDLIKKFTPYFLLKFYHYALAIIGAFFYGFPGRKIAVIGITGTNGKSTVVELAAKILEEAGFKTAALSSIKFKIGGREWENKLKMTMPGRLKIQKFLSQAVKAGCKFAVLEVTSEGIKQYRHKFIKFDSAVFNNLSKEHIEAHKGFENYRGAKLKLFKATKNIHIVNLDDENAKYFIEIPSEEKFCFGIDCKLKIDWKLKIENWKFIKADDVQLYSRGISFTVNNTQFKLNLLGGFNVYNAIAAISVGMAYNVSLGICKKALEKVEGIPGRMEIAAKEPFVVIVDYAHTPQSLIKVYETLRNPKSQFPITNQAQNPKDQKIKLICVLGSCGGGRDKWKRPVLGKIAQKYCDEIIITNEDPYDEDPMEIINQVSEGAGEKAEKILDRKEAIKKALESAKPGDAVIITGKGSEPWICIAGGKKIPWDDRKVVKEYLIEKKIFTP